MADSVSSSSVSINSWISWDNKNYSLCQGNDERKTGEISPIKTRPRQNGIRSMIDVVDQNGVEVTLDISLLPYSNDKDDKSTRKSSAGSITTDTSATTPITPSTPSSSRKCSISPTLSPPLCLRRSMNALLDDDVALATPATPLTPAFESKLILSASAQSCSESVTPRRLMFCGTVHDWCPSDTLSCTPEDVMKNYEWNISQSLGSPAGVQDWCHGWQSLSVFPALLEDPDFVWNKTSKEVAVPLATVEEDKLHVQRSLRSRAYNAVMRRQRVDKLRRNLNPFDVETNSSNRWNQRLAFGKTRSFNLTEPSLPPKVTKARSEKVLSIASVLECGALDCSTSFDAETPATIRKDHELTYYDQGYDSDPEDFTTFHRRNRQSPTNKENWTAVNSRMIFPNLDVLSCLVHDFLNEKVTLLWHRDVMKCAGPTSSIAVNVWVERGQRLHREILLPKLCWIPIAASNEANKSANDQIFYQSQQISSVELLDISRVLEVTKVDRSQYPFVRLPRAFIIRTLHDEYILEASSTQERNRLVETIKHVVARFASTVLLQDEKAILEFFTNRLPGPGELPRVFART